MKAVAERNSSIVLVQIDPDPSGETPFDTTRGVIVDTRRRTVSEPAYLQSILSRGYWTPFEGDPEDVLGIVASITAAGFVEAEHPRHPKGSEKGGEFAPKKGVSEARHEEESAAEAGSPAHRPGWLKGPAQTASEAVYKATREREAIAAARGELESMGVTEHNGIPINLLNAVGVVEAMNEHYPDGYEMFLSIEGLHKEDFRSHYIQNDGKSYTPERALEHAAWQKQFLDKGKRVPEGTQPQAIFLAGGPASGKSSIRPLIGEQDGTVLVNPDPFKRMSGEAKALQDAGDERWPMLAHEESSDVAAELRDNAIAAGFPITVDGTGDAAGPSAKYPEGKFMDKVRAAERAGYKTKIVMVDIPTDEAIRRSQARFEEEQRRTGKPGRKVGETTLRNTHREVVRRHLEWREVASDWEVWANDDDDQGGRRLIAQKVGGGPIEIIDRERYAQLERKAGE